MANKNEYKYYHLRIIINFHTKHQLEILDRRFPFNFAVRTVANYLVLRCGSALNCCRANSISADDIASYRPLITADVNILGLR